MNLEAPPPHNDQAEERLIGAMFIDPAAAQIAIEEVTEEDFYSPRHRQLFRAAKLCFTKHATLDEVFFDNFCKTENITEAITGGRDALGLIIAATPSAAGIEDYCALVKKSALDRKCIQICTELYAAAHLGRGGEELEKRGLIHAEPRSGDPFSWPPIETPEMRRTKPAQRPPVLIEGLAYQGAKISLTAPSKSCKTFTQQHLCVCVASGQPWHGMKVEQGGALYLNLELNRYSFWQRELAIYRAMGIEQPAGFDVWHLRGLNVTIEQLQSEIIRRVETGKYKLLCLDPLYKILASRDSNAANEMGDLLNRIESIGYQTGTSTLVAHHFAKGNASEKEVLDRGAGSFAIGADADTAMTLTPHEADDCFTLDFVVRDFAPLDSLVLRWNYPLFGVAEELDPGNLRKTTRGNVAPVTTETLLKFVTTIPRPRHLIVEECMKATGRGEKAVETAFANARCEGLIEVETLPRPGARPILRFYRKEKNAAN